MVRRSCLLGGGALAIWTNIDPEDEAEFNEWYTRQHLAERVGIEGFLRGRRYVAAATAAGRNESKYFTLYEIERVDTLTSPPYMERLDSPTEWSRRVLPLFRNGNRRAFRVVVSLGAGIGGQAATIGFSPMEGRESKLRRWLQTTAMPAAFDTHRLLTGIHLLESDEATTRAKDQTEEGRTARMAAPTADWALMVEGTLEDEVAHACDEIVAAGASHGMAEIHINRYQLVHGLLHWSPSQGELT
ncbi:MAG TPA: hypothetical protein VLR46_14520 [Candidatus Dormibacteraeota bacterium]|nr:hypothetical protein [Candidatus Dormibacteraeota bacterium]